VHDLAIERVKEREKDTYISHMAIVAVQIMVLPNLLQDIKTENTRKTLNTQMKLKMKRNNKMGSQTIQ
jgi:hypothetical protein